ncbi:hypothetical protein L218DRAFT_1009420 [Marasmius fiardii PR-910]|nr:hypothetical protein L218DRAFT_1009420 [Marasmius fiardii PR-910]
MPSKFTTLTLFVFAAISSVSHAAPNPLNPLTGLSSTGGAVPSLPNLPNAPLANNVAGGVPANSKAPSSNKNPSKLPMTGNLPIAGSALGSRGLLDKGLSLGGGSGGLPFVGGVVEGLPIVGGVVEGLPIVGGGKSHGNDIGTGGLPIVGGGGLLSSLPLSGGLLRRGLLVPDLNANSGATSGKTGLPILNDSPMLSLLGRHVDGPCGYCQEKSIVDDATTQIQPYLQHVASLPAKDITTDTLQPIIAQIEAVLGGVTSQISALATKDTDNSGSVSVGDVAGAVEGLVNSVLSTFGSVVLFAGSQDPKAINDLLAGPTGTLGDIIHSYTNHLGGDFTTAIVPAVTGKIQALVPLFGDVTSKFDFMGVNFGDIDGSAVGIFCKSGFF